MGMSQATKDSLAVQTIRSQNAGYLKTIRELEVELADVRTELATIKAERERVASGKTECADCGSLLARF